MRYVISYDISDNKKRGKIDKILSGYMYRVQRSVFEGIVSERSFKKLSRNLVSVDIEDTDSIRIYKICEKCLTKIEYLGKAKIIDDMEYAII